MRQARRCAAFFRWYTANAIPNTPPPPRFHASYLQHIGDRSPLRSPASYPKPEQIANLTSTYKQSNLFLFWRARELTGLLEATSLPSPPSPSLVLSTTTHRNFSVRFSDEGSWYGSWLASLCIKICRS